MIFRLGLPNSSRFRKVVMLGLTLGVLGLSFVGWRVSASRVDQQRPLRNEPRGGGEASNAQGLAAVLNPDGTLKTGAQGSFNPAGFAMLYGPNGEPRFVLAGSAAAQAGCMDGWDDRFFSDGASSTVNAVAVNGTDLYVAGFFRTAGNVFANRVARWDGASWSNVGNGLNGAVHALLVSGPTLYAGGDFSLICNDLACSNPTVQANRVAQFDGANWTAVGNGVSGSVLALAAIGSTLYAGGTITGICTDSSCLTPTHANFIAQFNAGTWSSAGHGFTADVRALAVNGTTLYAGGDFNRLCDNALCDMQATVANHVAQFNGTTWSAVGNGVNSSVNAMVFSGTTLYAGGLFTGVCNAPACSAPTTANRVAQFASGNWTAAGNGVDGSVSALALSGTALIAGGSFLGICTDAACSGTTAANGVAQFSSGSWTALSNGLTNTVNALGVIGGTIYAGGSLFGICTDAGCTFASGTTGVNNIAQFGGANWATVGTNNTINNAVRTIAINGSDVYVGGDFRTAGTVQVNRVARWNGTAWSAVGNGLNGSVLKLFISGTTLYAGGNFTAICDNATCSSSSTSANAVAQIPLSGGSWTPVGNGLNNQVNAFAVMGTTLYASGQFTGTCNDAACGGTTTANRVAQFDGANWSAVGNGLNVGAVFALAVSGMTLYAGGQFDAICGDAACTMGLQTPAMRVAQFSGGVWSAVGNGFGDGQVNLLAASATTLYAGGSFSTICSDAACSGMTPGNYIAQKPLSGGSWTPVGNGLNLFVTAMDLVGTTLYAGGAFTGICNDINCGTTTPINRVAQFDGANWTGFDGGLNGQALALVATSGGEIYVGGQFFQTAGCRVSVNFAHFGSTVPLTIAKSFLDAQIPVNGTTTLTFTINNADSQTLSNISFDDMFPAGLVVDTPVMTTNTCGGNFNPALTGGETSLTYQGGTLTAGNNCTITVRVSGTTSGVKPNTTGAISSTETGAAGTSNTATLLVVGPPVFSKAFAPTEIPINTTSTLTFTINNTVNTSMHTGLNFTDNLPAGILVAATPNASTTCTGGTLTAMGGTSVISYSGGSVAAMSTCTVQVDVQGTAAGTHTNISGALSSTEGGMGSTATAMLTVVAPPAISKAFSPAGVPVGQTSTLTFTITNPGANTVALTGVGFTDAFPNAPNLIVANPTGAMLSGCGGATLTDNLGGALAPGDLGVMLSNATITAGGTCTVQVNVSPQAHGTYNNVSGNVTSANGGQGNTAMATLTTNTPPTVSSNTIMIQAGSNAAPFTIATAADSDQTANTLGITIDGGATVTKNGITINSLSIAAGTGIVTANVSTVCGAPAGNTTFTLVVTDNASATGMGTLTVTVTPDTGPVLSYATQTVTAGATPSFNPATGPSDNGMIQPLALQSIIPATGLTLSLNPASGQILVTGATLIGGYTVTVAATDNCGTMTSAAFTINVICPAISLSPVSLPNATINTAYPQTITAGPAGGNYTFTVSSGLLPSGLTLDSNGSFSGAPLQSGVFNFRITASGFGGCAAFRDYVLVVECPDVTVAPSSLPDGTVGAAYSQTVTASPAGSYSYTVTSGVLPPGLTLNAASGQISGSPVTNGAYGFTITAAAGGCAASRAYSVTISCPAISLTTASPLPPGSVGAAYSQTLNVTPAGSYTFSLLSGGLPSGLLLNASTGVISGTPALTGTATFTVKAQAVSGCNATQSYTLTVNCPGITLSPASLPGGTVGAVYSQTIAASPAGGGYTYSVTSGVLPAGLNLNLATGNLSGTPTANATFTFTITATGFGGCTGSQAYTVVIGGGGCPAITLPATLPNGNVGQLYNAAATASPAGLYSYTVTGGSLPPGMTLFAANGLIFGYPTAVGSYSFTITATQGACSGSKMYTVLIGAGMASSLTVSSDFDGDGKSDLSVWRGSDGNWLVAASGDGLLQSTAWGASYAPYNDVTVSGDYDGDGKTDLAVFRRGGEYAGYWFIKRSSDGQVSSHFWGLGTDMPVPGDYDGDGKTDVAVWRGSAGAWYIVRSSDGGIEATVWGYAPVGDVPVPGDYDGDGKTDLAVFRRDIQGQQGGFWYILRSSDGLTSSTKWGVGTDVPAPGDYDGDNRTDIAVWRSSEAAWYIIESSSAVTRTVSLGVAAQGDVPVVADYDGDGKADAALWRASTGTWMIKRSRDGAETSKAHGQSGDTPIMARRN